MKKLLFIVFLMLQTAGYCQEWFTDFDAAKRAAATTNKKIFLLFTGPEWCSTCNKLDSLVWQSPEFIAEAEKSWVLFRADFHQKKGVPDPVDINDIKIILTEKYNRDGFFPFVVVLDKNGYKLGKAGYENLDTAAEYVAMYKNITR